MTTHRAPASVRRQGAPIPRQRTPRTGPRVTTSFDGSRWTYRVEGEPELGHSYADRAPAVAGGRYLARTLGAEHVVVDEDGTLLDQADWADSCSCHPRAGARPRA